MGGSPAQQFGTDYLSLTDQQKQQIQSGLGNYQSSVGDANSAAKTAAGDLNNNFTQYAPNLGQYGTNLNTQFSGPNFSSQLDDTSRGLLSQQNQQAAGQLATQRGQIASQFGAQNPGLAQVLQAQAGAQSQLGQNGNVFQAQLAQQARQAQVYQLGQQAQGLSNQAQLAQSQNNAGLAAQQANFGINTQQMNNQGVMNYAQLMQAPAQNNQSLASVMSALAALQGAHVSAATGSVPNTGLNRPGESAPPPGPTNGQAFAGSSLPGDVTGGQNGWKQNQGGGYYYNTNGHDFYMPDGKGGFTYRNG